jgi:protein-S-isoprenylcysteine O-methyltransferase Ste14
MVITGSLVIFGATIESLLRNFHLLPYLVGVCVTLTAFLLRAWAASALGKFWSIHVEVRPDHALVKTGPYAYIRHPIYTAALLETLGCVILTQAYFASLTLFPLLFAIHIRIRAEEQAMINQMGSRYVEYKNTTPALLPKLF